MIGGHGADNDLEGDDDGDNNNSVDDGRWQQSWITEDYENVGKDGEWQKGKRRWNGTK